MMWLINENWEGLSEGFICLEIKGFERDFRKIKMDDNKDV